ncbi:hypothetical protein E3A20_08850 [Planctomyces bekefii]|uniref:Dipeptidylpeptidase IV N-terminal domain-containing protein n=1 Tax=Planctomyces bekefii TaxID=1653850 RepID=A0A5C6M5C4_9PLAN|nr:hypothetical protein E3A20_08850 [Planctomyces bekefii]
MFRRVIQLALWLVLWSAYDETSLGVTPGVMTPETTPYLRLNDPLHHMRLDPKGRFMAYIREDGLGLRVVDMKSKDVFHVTDAQVGASFFWAPDGLRLFYRELRQTGKDEEAVESVIKAYDCALNKSVEIDRVTSSTGLLTFDPRDLRLQLMTAKGIRTKRIYFPDERLAKWQVAQRHEAGKWLATQAGMLWVTQGGYAMKKLTDDGTGVDSFSIAPDGGAVAWATRGGRVYMMRSNKDVKFIGHGRDPSWHPEKPEIVYAAARRVGKQVVSYDLRIVDSEGHGKYLTSSQFSAERWPHWSPNGQQLLYTVANSTDIYTLELKQ